MMKKRLLLTVVCFAGFASAVTTPKLLVKVVPVASFSAPGAVVTLVEGALFEIVGQVSGVKFFYAKCSELPKVSHSVALKSVKNALVVDNKGVAGLVRHSSLSEGLEHCDFSKSIAKKQNITTLFVHPKPEQSFVVQVTFDAKNADVRIYGTPDKVSVPVFSFVKTLFVKGSTAGQVAAGALCAFGVTAAGIAASVRRKKENVKALVIAGTELVVEAEAGVSAQQAGAGAGAGAGVDESRPAAELKRILMSDEGVDEKRRQILGIVLPEDDQNKFADAFRFAVSEPGCFLPETDDASKQNIDSFDVLANCAHQNVLNALKVFGSSDGLLLAADTAFTEASLAGMHHSSCDALCIKNFNQLVGVFVFNRNEYLKKCLRLKVASYFAVNAYRSLLYTAAAYVAFAECSELNGAVVA